MAKKVALESVTMPSSRLKESIAKVLQDEGYILGYEVNEVKGNKRELEVMLKYFDGKPVIENIQKVSKPGLRIYRGKNDLPKVLGGLGVAIVSTSKGVMTERQAQAQGFGGEVLCIVS